MEGLAELDGLRQGLSRSAHRACGPWESGSWAQAIGESRFGRRVPAPGMCATRRPEQSRINNGERPETFPSQRPMTGSSSSDLTRETCVHASSPSAHRMALGIRCSVSGGPDQGSEIAAWAAVPLVQRTARCVGASRIDRVSRRRTAAEHRAGAGDAGRTGSCWALVEGAGMCPVCEALTGGVASRSRRSCLTLVGSPIRVRD